MSELDAVTLPGKPWDWHETGPAPGMTAENIRQVQKSFDELAGQIDFFAQILYARLFAEYPHIKFIFKGDQSEQEKQLAHMLTAMVSGLERLDEIKPTLKALGQRHVNYGVRAHDYDAFFEALMWTLNVFLSDKFSPQVQEAWTSFYAFMAGIMQNRLDWRRPAERPGFDAA